MGTKIVVMKDGLIQQIGSPLEVYNFPINQFVAGFIGSPVMNFFPASLIFDAGRLFIDAKDFRLSIPEQKVPFYEPLAGSDVILGIRPNNIHDRLTPPDPIKENCLKAVVDVVEPLGPEIHLYVTSGRHNYIAIVDAQTSVRVGQEVELVVDLDKIHLFEKETPNLHYNSGS